MKTAFVFPGQGSQQVGMMRDLYEAYPLVRERFQEADEALGFSLSQLIFEGPDTELVKTEFTQPAILTASVAAYEVVKAQGYTPDVVAGHSLGEYSALVAAESLRFADAVKTVHYRGKFMQEAVPLGEGGMAAIIRLDREKINTICQEISTPTAPVEAVNFNCPGQVVIAGETNAVAKACEKMKEAGAGRAIMLNVSAPFHSVLMQPAAQRLAEVLAKIEISDAKIPVIANVNAQPLTAGAEIEQALVAQAAQPVLWEDSVRYMLAQGVENFVEIGPGKVLTGFTKKIDRAAHTANVEDEASLADTLVFLQGVQA